MKRVLCVIMLISSLLLVSCGNGVDFGVCDDEYDRVGKNTIEAMVTALVEPQEAYETADLIAMVRIDKFDNAYFNSYSILGETVFSATIIETYEDRRTVKSKEIFIAQVGTPEGTMKGIPLYKTGDTFIMFLKVNLYNGVPYGDSYGDNVYSDINELHGVLQVISVNNERYVVNRMLGGFCKDIKASAVSENVRGGVISALYEYDSVLNKHAYAPSEVYKLSTFSAFLEGLK